jgi:hypothetical protein
MKNYNWGIYLVIGGLLLVMLMAGSNSRSSLARLSGEDFTIGIVNDYKTPIVVGTQFTVRTSIHNSGDVNSEMYAQCSLFDYNIHKSWIDTYPRAASAATVFLPMRDNCVDDEPFTQTAKVSLSAGETKTVPFTITVPEGLDTEHAILWCGTFDRCYSDSLKGDNPIGASDSDYRYVAVKAAGAITPEEQEQLDSTADTTKYQCSLNQDCPAYYVGSTKCSNGYCVDIPAKDVKLDNSTIKQWAQAHSIIIFLIGMALVLVGVYVMYEKP